MQALLQRRTFDAHAFGKSSHASRQSRICRPIVQARNDRKSRRTVVECHAFFNFFTPKPAASPASLIDPRAKPLVERLVALTSGTDAGSKASPTQKEQVADVVSFQGGNQDQGGHL